MGELVAAAYERTKRYRWIWVAVLVAAVAVASWSISRAQYSRDLFDALPADVELERYRGLLTAAGIGQGRIAVGFHGQAPTDSLAVRARRFAEGILQRHPSAIDSVFWRPDPSTADAISNDLLDRMALYAAPDRIAALSALDSLGVDSLVRGLRSDLARPGAELLLMQRLQDPVGLVQPMIDRTLSGAATSGVILVDGQLFAQDSSMAFVFLFPTTQGAANGEALMALVASEVALVSGDGVRGDAFGGVPMAQANSERIGKDTLFTSLLAALLVVLILVWQYRSIRVPLMFLVPPLVGYVIGLGVLAWYRPVVSALALGASAALLGITLDYCFHFFTHLRHRRDIALTLKDIAAPMLLSSTTTVLAFGILSFMGSRVLADLGFLAAFMLLGAAFTVLFVLPHFSRIPGAPVETAERPRRKWGARWGLWVVLAVTVALSPYVDEVTYDQDPEGLTWIPEGMKAVRDALEGETRAIPVFVAGSGRTEEEARMALEGAARTLRSGEVKDMFGDRPWPTDYLPSETECAHGAARWASALPQEDLTRMARWFKAAAKEHGFVAEAFDPFIARLSATVPTTEAALLRAISGEVVVRGDQETIVAGRILVPPSEVPLLSEALVDVPGVSVLHRGLLGDRIAQLVGQDLERILVLTSLIVFLALLITYGRIELALFTFLPMALGWWWILGICGAFGISFDLVNILVCTFVFGLGDDYCIFTMEGLLERYRSGMDHTGPFRSAVVLSVVTTILGTGVLLFAEHPALRSIAVLSVTGMAVLLVIALTVQPTLFRFFISGRSAKGRMPFTLFSFLVSVFAFVYFLVGCILLMLFMPALLLLPLGKARKRHLMRCAMRLFCWSLVYVMANTRKDIESFREAIAGRPSIIIANHASFVDILVMLMITPRVVMMTNRWVWNSPFFGRVVRFAGHLAAEEGMDVNEQRVREAVGEGLSVIIFPEGTRSRDGSIGRFHKGAFHLAEALHLPIIPVVLHGIGYAMPKGDAMLKDTLLTMRTLPAIEPGDERFGEGARERSKRVAQWFREAYAQIRDQRETPSWFRKRLIRTFTYKGAVLEWYTRVKSRMDEGLHEVIHASIARTARVVDLGCGHGMVPQLLAWSAPERSIVGVDRDAEKVAIATEAGKTSSRLSYLVADLDDFEPPTADAYILKDVLHYLIPGRQRELLLACAERLPIGGAIFVRDGFVSTGRDHRRTRWTERISTGIGFNRAKHELHFMSKGTMEGIATEAGLRIEWRMASSYTSNELAILTRVQ